MLGGAGRRRRRRLTRCSTSPAVPRVGPAHAGESPAPRRHPNHSEAPGSNHHSHSARRHWEVKRDVRAIWQGLGTGRRCRSTLWACPGNGPARPGGAGSGAGLGTGPGLLPVHDAALGAGTEGRIEQEKGKLGTASRKPLTCCLRRGFKITGCNGELQKRGISLVS